MRYSLELRARADKHQSIEEKHERFVNALALIPAPWGLVGKRLPTVPDAGRELVASVNLGRFLGKGISGYAHYLFRTDFRDTASDDDVIDLTFDPTRVNYHTLIHEVLLEYVKAFDAYLAQIADERFIDRDFDELRRVRFDARRMIYRVFPVSFFDAILCKQALGLTPEDVKNRLEGTVERVEVVKNGVFIVATSGALELDEAERLSDEVRSRLAIRA